MLNLDSKAEKVGFQPGDVIIQIEEIEIKNFADMQQAIRKYNKKDKRVYVNRYGQTILLAILNKGFIIVQVLMIEDDLELAQIISDYLSII